MGKLIDADELIKNIGQFAPGKMDRLLNMLIRNMPEAYNTEKVADEVIEIIDLYYDEYDGGECGIKRKVPDGKCADYKDCADCLNALIRRAVTGGKPK